MGIRVVQLTYNNQNDFGGSCYEAEDSGLSRFGREIVHEMNRAGILVDLSHVGNRTTLDVVKHSVSFLGGRRRYVMAARGKPTRRTQQG